MFFPRQHLWVSLFPNWIHSVAGICVHACFNKPYAGLHNLHPSSSEQKLRKFRVRVCALTSVLTARTPGHAQRWIKYLTAWNLILCVLLTLIALLKKVHPYSPYPHTQPCLSVWATVCPGDSKTEWQVQAAPWHPQTLPPASTLHTAPHLIVHSSLLPSLNSSVPWVYPISSLSYPQVEASGVGIWELELPDRCCHRHQVKWSNKKARRGI